VIGGRLGVLLLFWLAGALAFWLLEPDWTPARPEGGCPRLHQHRRAQS
jgi:hypothetical protein